MLSKCVLTKIELAIGGVKKSDNLRLEFGKFEAL